MRPDLRSLPARHPLANGIVLIRGKRHPDYASAVVYNPVDLGGEQPVYVWDRGGNLRQRLVGAYPGRDFWIVDGPTRTGRGYEVVAGPLSSSALLSRTDTVPAQP
jgi:hypothetical protein